MSHVPVLKQTYREKVAPALKESRGYQNVHEIPGVEKIVLNTAVGTRHERSVVEEAAKDLALIAGQKPVITNARKSVSNFKVREGMPLGAKVTLRGAHMWEFLYRLITVALPGIRDFRGVNSKLDGNGNYMLGIADHTIFPEISAEGHKQRQMGLDICIVTTAKTDEEGRELLTLLGMPFRKR